MKIELSHDLLAKKIHEKASSEDKMLMRIRKFIHDRFNYFDENRALLSWTDINYITPYLDKISLEPHETRFIRRSKDRIWIIAITIGVAALGMLGVVFYFINQTNRIEKKSQERMAAQIARYEEISQHAEELSSALTESREGLDATKEELHFALLALQERNDTLVNSYATYKVQQSSSNKQLQTELQVAQSAKLSELAASLVSLDKGYSFRLAAKAWNLNPENKQAIRTLCRIADAPKKKNYSKQQCYTIIKKYQSKWGSLSPKELTAIFDPENNITAKEDIAERVQQTIKTPSPPTSSPMQQKTEEVKQQIEAQRQKIQQQVQQINMQQQKLRQQSIQRRK
ncbi:MAG: hypothetical protein ACRBFS_10720 [Aureispira sp.]